MATSCCLALSQPPTATVVISLDTSLVSLETAVQCECIGWDVVKRFPGTVAF